MLTESKVMIAGVNYTSNRAEKNFNCVLVDVDRQFILIY